jgi:methylated-DNA-[protein]-cysteine S-methyltransferase
MLAFAAVDSPFGELLAVRSGRGIVRVLFPEEDRNEAAEEIQGELGARLVDDSARLAGFARELGGYFAGRRRMFRTPADLSLARGFARRVLEAVAAIPYGAVATYGEVAARAGSRRGGRAAGNALRWNPVPIVVPCHRVLPADGSLGGYGGHEDRKAYLLELEAGYVAQPPGTRR